MIPRSTTLLAWISLSVLSLISNANSYAVIIHDHPPRYAIAEGIEFKARYDAPLPPPPPQTPTPTPTPPPPATPTPTPTPTSTPTPCIVAEYWACGGMGYQGCTTCAPGLICTFMNSYYSWCRAPLTA